MATRKAAVDAAQQTFRSAQEKLVSQRQEAIRAAASTMKASISAALAKAQADCTAGVSPETVKETLANSIKAAIEKFRTDIRALDKIGTSMREIAATRNK